MGESLHDVQAGVKPPCASENRAAAGDCDLWHKESSRPWSQSVNLNHHKMAAAMEVRRMSQADLVRTLGWSEAKVSRYIRGLAGEVTLTTIRELAQALQVSPAHLIDLEDVAQTDEEKALLRDFRKASARDRKIAKQALEDPEQH